MRIFASLVPIVGLCACAGGDDDVTAAERAAAPPGVCVETPPPHPAALPGTDPTIQPYTGAHGNDFNFDCRGACGASCKLSGLAKKTEDHCVEWQDCVGNWKHRVDHWELTGGETHEWCTWHDECYFQCSSQFENYDWNANFKCQRWCDAECVSPGSWTLIPSEWTWLNPVAPAMPPKPVPRTWTDGDCARWASTKLGFDPTGTVPATGYKWFSRFLDSTAPIAGRCDGGAGLVIAYSDCIKMAGYYWQAGGTAPTYGRCLPIPPSSGPPTVAGACANAIPWDCKWTSGCEWVDDPIGFPAAGGYCIATVTGPCAAPKTVDACNATTGCRWIMNPSSSANGYCGPAGVLGADPVDTCAVACDWFREPAGCNGRSDCWWFSAGNMSSCIKRPDPNHDCASLPADKCSDDDECLPDDHGGCRNITPPPPFEGDDPCAHAPPPDPDPDPDPVPDPEAPPPAPDCGARDVASCFQGGGCRLVPDLAAPGGARCVGAAGMTACPTREVAACAPDDGCGTAIAYSADSATDSTYCVYTAVDMQAVGTTTTTTAGDPSAPTPDASMPTPTPMPDAAMPPPPVPHDAQP